MYNSRFFCLGERFLCLPNDEDQDLVVETSQQAILHFKVLDAQHPHVSQLQPLLNGSANDYHVVGWIEAVVPISEHNYIFSVRADGLRIDLDMDDTAGQIVCEGDWVQFTLIGLSLRNENL